MYLASALVLAALLGGVTEIDTPSPAGSDRNRKVQRPRGWLDENSQDEAKTPPRVPLPRLPLPPNPTRVRVWGFVKCVDAEGCPAHPLPWTIRTDRRSWDRRIYLPEDYNPPVRLSETGQPLVPHIVIAAISEDGRSTWETRSYADGKYSLTVPPGNYRIVVDEPPYARFETWITVPDTELHGPNPLLDGNVADGPDFIPFDAMRVDLVLAPDSNPDRCPAMSCGSCARCLTLDAYDLAEDGSKNLVHGVEVVIVNPEGKRWYSRTQNGLVIFSTIPEGWYYIAGKHPSHGRVAPTDGWKYVGGHIDGKNVLCIATARFRVGPYGEYIEVTERLKSNEIGGAGHGIAFDHREIESTPLSSGRTLQSLQSLVPGIVFTEQTGSLAQFTAIGQRRLSNRMTIDGVSADLAVDVRSFGITPAQSGGLPAIATLGSTQTLVPFGAIEETQIRTTNANPAFARTAGAQTAVVTRAGSEQTTGSLFGEWRPRQLAAGDWLSIPDVSRERPRSVGTGATLGGPLVRGRLFYFAAWEGQKVRRPVSRTLTLPSPALRDTASASSREVLASFPRPDADTENNGFARLPHRYDAPSQLSSLSARFDAASSSRNRVFGRLQVGSSEGEALPPNPQVPFATYASLEATTTKTATLGWTSLSASTAHEFRINLSTHAGERTARPAEFGAAQSLPIDVLAAPGVSPANSFVLLNLYPRDEGVVINGLFASSRQQQLYVSDSWTLARGRHSWQWGGEYLRRQAKQAQPAYHYTYRFDDIPQMLAGRVRLLQLRRFAPANVQFESGALFLQDTFRASSALTLEYGARYSVAPAPSSTDATQPLLLDNAALPDVQVLPRGSQLWKTSYKDISPRVALSLRVSNNATLRAGWSLVHDELTLIGGRAFGDGYPYQSQRSVANVGFPVASEILSGEFPQPFSQGAQGTYYSFPERLRTPAAQQWQIGMDFAYGASQRVSLAYVGTSANNLPYWYSYAVTPSEIVNAYSNAGRATYNGLLAEHVANWQGLNIRTVYTLSRTIDVDSGEGSSAQAPPSIIPPSANRGPATFDRRHTLRTAASYEVPTWYLPVRLQSFVGDWRVELGVTMQSGAPIDVTAPRPLPGLAGTYVLRPDLTGAPIWLVDPSEAGGRRLNPAAFTLPSAPRQGTLQRNSIVASSLNQVDLSLSRWQRFGERVRVQLRVEAFNVFNVENVGVPFSTWSPNSDVFGRPQGTYAETLGSGTLSSGGLTPLQQLGGPRSVQVSARIVF